MASYSADVIKTINRHQKAARRYAAAFWLYLSCLFTFGAVAARQDEDTVHNILPDLVVRQQGRSPIRKTDDGNVTIQTKDILRLSRAFGEADLLDKVRSLPLAETGSDYSSGLSVDGSEPGQSQYLVGGAPVIFPYRFGGIFSTFNAPHFASMDFTRQSGASLPPRLGAAFRLSPALRFRPGAEGSVSIGMTASSLSARAGIADRMAISLSGRVSYIDRLYGKWLSSSDMGIRYAFHDLNADAAFKVTNTDIVSLSFLHSADKLSYDDSKYAIETSIRWHNTLYRLGYAHKGDLEINVNAYHSRFDDRLSLTMPQMTITAPASLSTSGADFSIGKGKTRGRLPEWDCGIRLIHDRTVPQWASLEMTEVNGAAIRTSDTYPQKMTTAIVHGKGSWWIIDSRLRLTAETGIGWFESSTRGAQGYSRLILTPSLTLNAIVRDTRLSLTAALLNQPMHRVGFSELGLATDFWIGANADAPMQRGFALSANGVKRLPWWSLDIEAGAFWNSVRNQTEYQGQVIETIDTEYSPFSHLLVADGFNYGAYASLSRTFGSFTGDLSVSYSSGLRHTPGQPSDSWAPLHAQGLSIKASAVWTVGVHWTLSAAFRLASGRRYTPVEALYMIGENIAMVYGKRNSARLPLYHRLDLGATYSFSTGERFRLRHLVNLSIFNAYGHRNVEMQYFILNSENGDYTLKRLYSLYRFLPSVSYSIEF